MQIMFGVDCLSYGPTNLENHLKTHKKTHKEEYEKYLLEKATAAASASARGKSSGKTKKVAVLGNKTIESSFQEQRERNDGIKKNSEKYNVNVRSIGVALAGNSLAHMLIEDRLFRNMLKTVSDGRMRVFPNRQEISSVISSFEIDFKNAIKRTLENAKYLNLAIDLWSRPGFASSMMGVTCHYFDRSRNELMRVLLACRKIEHPHTAGAIFELFAAVMHEWNISDERIFRILTDNGSNVVAAFK